VGPRLFGNVASRLKILTANSREFFHQSWCCKKRTENLGNTLSFHVFVTRILVRCWLALSWGPGSACLFNSVFCIHKRILQRRKAIEKMLICQNVPYGKPYVHWWPFSRRIMRKYQSCWLVWLEMNCSCTGRFQLQMDESSGEGKLWNSWFLYKKGRCELVHWCTFAWNGAEESCWVFAAVNIIVLFIMKLRTIYMGPSDLCC